MKLLPNSRLTGTAFVLCLFAACTDASVEGWLTAHAVPMSDVRAERERLQDFVGDARIVGLGEPAHWVHEPLVFRNELFAFLVEEMDFTAVAVEGICPAESKVVNDYIAAGVGDGRALLRQVWFEELGNYDENWALVEWLRQHNARQTGDRAVRFYGFDMCGGHVAPAGRGLGPLVDYLEGSGLPAAARTAAALRAVTASFDVEAYAALPERTRNDIDAALQAAAATLAHERAALIEQLGEDAHAWATWSTDKAIEEAEFIKVAATETPSDVTRALESGAPLPSGQLRTDAMADNAEWIVQREGPQGRVALYAHTVHLADWVSRGAAEACSTGQGHITLTPMGRVLRQRFGAGYRILGAFAGRADPVEYYGRFCFEGQEDIPQGEPVVWPATPMTPFEATLTEVSSDAYLVDLRQSMPREVSDYLGEGQVVRAGGELHRCARIEPAAALDGLVFFPTLTPGIHSAPPAR